MQCLNPMILIYSGRKTLPGQSFTCPNRCEEKTELPLDGVAGLKTDFYVVGIRSYLKRRQTEKQASVKTVRSYLILYISKVHFNCLGNERETGCSTIGKYLTSK